MQFDLIFRWRTLEGTSGVLSSKIMLRSVNLQFRPPPRMTIILILMFIQRTIILLAAGFTVREGFHVSTTMSSRRKTSKGFDALQRGGHWQKVNINLI